LVTIRESVRSNILTVTGVYSLQSANSVPPPPPTGSCLSPGDTGAFFMGRSFDGHRLRVPRQRSTADLRNGQFVGAKGPSINN
jgi:hypothetical protein